MWSYSCLAVYEIIHNSCKELQHTPEITHNFICDISCGGFWSRLTWCMWTDQGPVGAVQGADPHGQSGEIPRLGSHRGCNHWLGSGMVTVARWSRRVSLGLQKAEISGVADELPFSPGNTSFDTCATQPKMPARFSHSSTKNVPSSCNLLFRYRPGRGTIRPHVRLQPPRFLPFHIFTEFWCTETIN